MRQMMWAIALLGILGGVVGCGGSDSPAAPSFTFSGNWQGVAQDSAAGTGVFRATLTQNGSSVTGTWFIQFPAAAFQNSGSVSGTATNTSLSLTLTPSDPTTCPFRLSANASGNQMSGTYAAFNCTGSIAGTFTASR